MHTIRVQLYRHLYSSFIFIKLVFAESVSSLEHISLQCIRSTVTQCILNHVITCRVHHDLHMELKRDVTRSLPLPSPCHKLSHLLGPPPPSSVTYFMDGLIVFIHRTSRLTY